MKILNTFRFVLLFLICSVPCFAAQSGSTHYTLQNSAVTSGSSKQESASYKTSVTSVSTSGGESSISSQYANKSTTPFSLPSQPITPAKQIPSGDINGDGKVDIADALKALQISVGMSAPSAAELAAGDVAPLAGGKPVPNGVINVGDAVVILQRAVGLVSW